MLSGAAPADRAQDILLVRDAGDDVRLLTFNRPSKANAFSEELLRRIADELTTAKDDPEIRAVVATGSGNAFAAGVDLEEWQDKEPLELWSSKRNEYWRTFNQFPSL